MIRPSRQMTPGEMIGVVGIILGFVVFIYIGLSSKSDNEPKRSRKSNWHNSHSTRMDLKGKDGAQRSKSKNRNRNTRMELGLDRPKRIGSTD
ncbi:hypothetical protein WR25_04180 [Diploscapter pachys]|uniref:Uncharacterized protein n=1 Tax=Diploscapter pachys TaxID=2018661 RepID=A0A2A2LG37_9BILA|nr:hypothetical protein WR25_04180 [Diploscapter pachys]